MRERERRETYRACGEVVGVSKPSLVKNLTEKKFQVSFVISLCVSVTSCQCNSLGRLVVTWSKLDLGK